MRVLILSFILAISFLAHQAKPAADKDQNPNQTRVRTTQEQNESSDSTRVAIDNTSDAPPSTQQSQAVPTNSSYDPPIWTDRVNAFSTLTIAVFTILLFFGLVVQIRTSRAIERAWVLVDVAWDSEKWTDRKPHVLQGSGTSGDTTGIFALLMCQNEGKSPAWIDEKRAKFEIVSALPLKPNFESAEFLQTGPEPIGIGNAKPPKTRLPWIAEAIGHEQTGKMMIIYGFVKYRDIFGKSRETRFGYRITPSREFVRLEGKEYREYNKHI